MFKACSCVTLHCKIDFWIREMSLTFVHSVFHYPEEIYCTLPHNLPTSFFSHRGPLGSNVSCKTVKCHCWETLLCSPGCFSFTLPLFPNISGFPCSKVSCHLTVDLCIMIVWVILFSVLITLMTAQTMLLFCYKVIGKFGIFVCLLRQRFEGGEICTVSCNTWTLHVSIKSGCR